MGKFGLLGSGQPRFASDLTPLLEPEQVMPAQWGGGPAPRTGEQKLQLAVLENALMEWRWLAGEERDELERWFQRRDVYHPFSFAGICDSLKLDPDWLHGLVRSMEQNGRRTWRVHRAPATARTRVVMRRGAV